MTGKEILKIACDYFEINYDLSLTKTREQKYVIARQMTFAAWQKMQYRGKMQFKTLNSMGAELNKDHATVLHSLGRVSDLCEVDNVFRINYNAICSIVEHAIENGSEIKARIKNILDEELNGNYLLGHESKRAIVNRIYHELIKNEVSTAQH